MKCSNAAPSYRHLQYIHVSLPQYTALTHVAEFKTTLYAHGPGMECGHNIRR